MQNFKVNGMTCDHCVRAVTEAVKAVDPDATVDVDLAAGRVSVESTAAPAQLTQAIFAEGYAAEPAAG